MSFWDRVIEELKTLGELIVEWAILIVVALLVLVIGRWILKWVRRITERLLGLLNPMWDRSGVTAALEPSGQTAASIGGIIVYAYLMVGLWLVAVRILHLETIELLLERLLAWIPLLLLAAIIVIVAAAAANWTAGLIRPFADNRNVPWLTWAVQVSIIIFGALFALDVLDITFAEDIVKIVIGAFGIALAVAFGVGGIDAAKQWWAKYGSPNMAKREAQAPAAPDEGPSGM